MPTKVLPVPYHRQQDTDYCGAACLQMVIEALGLKSKDQDDLYVDAHAHGQQDPKTNWYSPPDGLEWTLDAITGLQADFDVCSLTKESALTRRLVWSLFNASAAPIALVYGFTHWVVVVGYDIDQDPTGPTDAGYVIRALEIHDPWRTELEANPPPPPPPRHVAYREWLSKYLKPVPTGYWVGQVVAVGDFGTAHRPPVYEPPPIAPGSESKTMLSPEAAQAAALTGLEEQGLLKREDWRARLASPIEAQKPLLVQRLDVADDFYYLVPFGEGDRPAGAVVRVDAFSGEYLEANAFSTSGEGRPWGAIVRDWQSDDTARRQIIGRKFELPNRGGRVLARREGIGIHPSFIWKPCVESLSPYYPFRLLTIGDTPRYVRLDGEVFDRLHDAGPGM
jgi:hypothetical protein